jgi:RNA polymerase-associated protein
MNTTVPVVRRPMMTLYSGIDCLRSHICRIVLHEKDIECHVLYVQSEQEHTELAQLNPYDETPTLLDRELVLYDTQVICEFLDERLPHPPLMPVEPIGRARARLLIRRLERDWFSLLPEIQKGRPDRAEKRRKQLSDGLLAVSQVFNAQKFLLGEEFSLIDCYLSALLWRLPSLGIKLPPKQSRHVDAYAARLFARPAFRLSLSAVERGLR